MSHILIIEDDPSLQSLYQEAIKAAGFDVILSRDGEEALRVAQEHTPDLILLDLLLPKMGGLEFLRAYMPVHPQVRVVVFSNMDSPELYDEAKKLGARQYLIKSQTKPHEVVEAVRAALK